jgi:hypothetical protein
MDYTGNMRYLKAEWWLNDLSTTNTHIVMLNSNSTTKDVTLKFATSATDRPTFGVFIRIY